jgi:hypothetical protein
MENAACAQVDPDLWHAEGSGAGYGYARRICQRCPVQPQCIAHTVRLEGDRSSRDRHGLWAGQGPKQRVDSSGHVTRETNHDVILRLTERGGLDAYEIAEHVGVDVRTVWRVVKHHREQMGEAA